MVIAPGWITNPSHSYNLYLNPTVTGVMLFCFSPGFSALACSSLEKRLILILALKLGLV